MVKQIYIEGTEEKIKKILALAKDYLGDGVNVIDLADTHIGEHIQSQLDGLNIMGESYNEIIQRLINYLKEDREL